MLLDSIILDGFINNSFYAYNNMIQHKKSEHDKISDKLCAERKTIIFIPLIIIHKSVKNSINHHK